jgi:hypothetical protein
MLDSLFNIPKPVIGMIHVGALPGTPGNRLSAAELVREAASEARLYASCGIDGLIIENMHDVPYLRGAVGPEIVAAMALCGAAVKEESGLAVGVQILAGANMEALAVAHAAGLDFIRAEGYAFAHIADEGWIESSAAELLRYRRQIGAERVQVWADVKKKHSSHAITTDVSLGATAEAVEFMRGDAVILTGATTGRPPGISDLDEVRARCRLPLVLGSGVSAENIGDFYTAADGFIVGSQFKAGGLWSNPPEERRVRGLMEVVRGLRG